MKLAQALKASEAAGILIEGIKTKARLAYRLGRIQDKLEAPIKGFQKARSALIQQHGDQQVTFTYTEVIEGFIPTQLPTDDNPLYTYQCSVKDFKKINEKITETNRDMYTFTTEKKQLFEEELESLLNEDVEMPIKIELAMFDGVEVEGLGKAITNLGDIVVEE